ncbi:MAG: preprotein translocase subunit SecE [Candidatus Pacebacteria bacterium]|nr:preprotein translocase subunit SecE [Candidatus Paceibacterota bacterium]MDD2796796.1 preprotein translocase subunit SecE [Candidatus Paceibacterota bacterium]MDD3047931.1 preprotein translocase subunit SecE [Candidatus Paceibacterota bacterium]MDD3510022.1 preprotein translocase subunit SecE [Candidatus Paceibacterota bacterium]MDD3918495.1 preprotein translocase subunit SecE [Candidatus Paceibacterota bacterium]
MNKKGNFFKDILRELRNVTWPTKKETIKYVVNVIIFSFVVAAVLGMFDLLFLHMLETYIIK